MPAAHERVFPERDLLKAVYAFLKEHCGADGRISYRRIALTRRFSRERGHISRYTMETALCIFQELGLLTQMPAGEWQLVPPVGKLELMDAPTYRRHMERKEDV